MAHYHCHYGFSYNLFSHMLCDFTPHFVRPSVLCLVGCLLPPKWSSDLKYGSCPPARTLDSCVSSLIVIRCALSFCISYSVIHCSITIKNGQNGNTGIRHNRKKTISPLRSVIAGFHCTLTMQLDHHFGTDRDHDSSRSQTYSQMYSLCARTDYPQA